ncbi:lipid-binding SYLF domain-containing protein [Modicisalibacter coralii]|uniref:lipid-binding SYLF domain-containing protein n=1 Tax=Modicisalibacter coralii TaxID=2304602 RepID=UPI001396769D|nr:lipid-binding SYLF domain-containing protein [Halomonas coralii]
MDTSLQRHKLTAALPTLATLAVAGTLGLGQGWAASSDSPSQQDDDAAQSISATNNAQASATGVQAEETKTAYYAAGVLQSQLQQSQDQQIPKTLINDARCIGVFPAVLKVGVVFAGAHGDGMVSCRDESGGWEQSAPVFFSVSSGSVGAQAGAKTSELIVLFSDEKSVKELSDGSFKFGADVGVVAGPVGTHAEVTTQPAKVVAYQMSETGAFAGAQLQGTVIQANNDAIHYVYGNLQDPAKLLTHSTQVPDNLAIFNQALEDVAPQSQYQSSDKG